MFKKFFRKRKNLYDMHTHSTASDGTLTPTQLIDEAISKNLKGIALTDHDTVKGIGKAINYSRSKDFELIPGIEISCDCEEKVKEVHLVGLWIDYKNPAFKKIEKENMQRGKKKAKEIISKLKNLGYKINFKDLEKKRHYGKNNLAYLLLEKYPNDFSDRKDVFNKLLGWGKPAMVYGEGPTIKEAINLIHKTGGLAILAHPGQLREFDDYFIEKFIKNGGDGLETGKTYKYLEDGKKRDKKYKKLAKKYNLLISKGTDFHKEKPGNRFGKFGLTEKDFYKLKNSAKSKSIN